jgi:hypothetical protein
MTELTVARLRGLLHYDPETGVFTWRVRVGNRVPGDVAGIARPRGYYEVTVGGRVYRAHRLAWFYVHGEWPADQIDHVNGDPSDNRLANLRPAARSQNNANRKRCPNASGYKGVSRDRTRWKAQICVDGQRFNLGYFGCPVEAHAAYVRAAEERFGEFARAG